MNRMASVAPPPAQHVEITLPGGFFLRAMQMEDLPQVAALETQSQRDPWPQQSFRAELENPRVSRPMVMVRKTEIAGFIVPWFIEDEVQIANIAVKANYRRQGLGSVMLSQIIHWAQRCQCRAAFLEVRRSNLAARRLYENLGFVEDGCRRQYYGREQEDAILMRKNLAPEHNH